MAGGAGQAIAIKQPIDRRVRIHRSGQHCYGVVAAVAMPRKFDSFGAQQDVDACAVKAGCGTSWMKCLAPLMEGSLVAMATILRVKKSARLQKIVSRYGGVSRD